MYAWRICYSGECDRGWEMQEDQSVIYYTQQIWFLMVGFGDGKLSEPKNGRQSIPNLHLNKHFGDNQREE